MTPTKKQITITTLGVIAILAIVSFQNLGLLTTPKMVPISEQQAQAIWNSTVSYTQAPVQESFVRNAIGDFSKVSSQQYNLVTAGGGSQILQVTCTSTCTGNQCHPAGCNPQDGTWCTSGYCNNGTATPCTFSCTKTVTGSTGSTGSTGGSRGGSVPGSFNFQTAPTDPINDPQGDPLTDGVN